MPPHRLLLLALIAGACGPVKPDQTTDDPATSSASSSSTSATSATTVPPVTTTDTQGPTTNPDPTHEPATNSPPDPSGFTTDEDPTTTIVTSAVTTGGDDTTTSVEPVPCDLSEQDCPEGQKCSVVAMSPEDIFQGTFQCVPLVPDPAPAHAACDVFGDPADGTDDCELGAICLFPDDDGIGECFNFCNFNHDPICQPPGDLCIGATCQSCTWSFCDSPCDVLDPDTCKPGEVCGPGGDNSWMCLLDASGDEGQHGDACDFLNSCDPGLVCVEKALVPPCAGDTSGCCSTMCDTTAPNTCPDKNKGTSCKPWYEEGQAPNPELAKLGVCAL